MERHFHRLKLQCLRLAFLSCTEDEFLGVHSYFLETLFELKKSLLCATGWFRF